MYKMIILMQTASCCRYSLVQCEIKNIKNKRKLIPDA